MELDKFKTMMNVRKRMDYFLRVQRMAGSENQVTIDEEAWKLVLPDQWNLSGEHEKAIHKGFEVFIHDINSIENKRTRKYFIIHYCYRRKKIVSECVEMAGTSSTIYHRYKQIDVLNFTRIHQNGELEVYKQANVGRGFIFALYFCFVLYWTTKNTTENYKHLEMNLGAFVRS